MPSVAQDENYERLFQIYAWKFPTDSPETIRWLIEMDLRNEMAGNKSREEAVLQILEKYHTVKQQIEKYENSVERLTRLFANREISEESYKRAIKSLENEIERLEGNLLTSNSVEEIEPLETFSEAEKDILKKEEELSIHSIFWWFVPFFFGILGGLIAYIGVKSEDEGMAKSLLSFGLLWSLFLIIIALFIIYG